MTMVSAAEAQTIMRFFHAHRTAERPSRKCKKKNLTKQETNEFIATTGEREALKSVVARLTNDVSKTKGDNTHENELRISEHIRPQPTDDHRQDV
jgi:hypothetical protein